MSIDLQKPVHGDRTYEVRFANDVESTGTALVLVGWVPNSGSAVPAAQERWVAPAATASVKGTVPASSAAHRMAIIVSLDKGEFGELELLENGKTHTVETITETTTWEMVVI